MPEPDLATGRLDLAARDATGDTGSEAAVHRYIGRIGLRDADLQPILLDWRVPQASAFYQATAFDRHGDRVQALAADSDALAVTVLTDLGGSNLEITTGSLDEAFLALTAPTDAGGTR